MRRGTGRPCIVCDKAITDTQEHILQKVQERIAQQHAQSQLPPATIINTAVKASKPHDPRPPRLAVVSALPGDSETKPT